MKRILAIFLCLSFLLVITGCDLKKDNEISSAMLNAWQAIGSPAVSNVFHCSYDQAGLQEMKQQAVGTVETLEMQEYFENEDEYDLAYGFGVEQMPENGRIFYFACDKGNVFVLMDMSGSVIATADEYEMAQLADKYSDLFAPEILALPTSEQRVAKLQSNLDKAEELNKRIVILSGSSVACANAPAKAKADINTWHQLPEKWVVNMTKG